MTVKLRRTRFSDLSTQGELYLNEVFFCYTLEDRFRAGDIFKVKVPGATCIPSGTYQVICDHSARFNKTMPHVLNVPNFEGVRIHSGNEAKDTDGCILVGMIAEENFIGQSKDAYNALFSQLLKAQADGEKIILTITNDNLVA